MRLAPTPDSFVADYVRYAPPIARQLAQECVRQADISYWFTTLTFGAEAARHGYEVIEPGNAHVIDTHTALRGMARLVATDIKVAIEYKTDVRNLFMDCMEHGLAHPGEAPEDQWVELASAHRLDGELADIIIQAGLLGHIVYG